LQRWIVERVPQIFKGEFPRFGTFNGGFSKDWNFSAKNSKKRGEQITSATPQAAIISFGI